MLTIEAKNIKKYYGDRLILDIDDLEIYSEDRIGIVGINGAGKTTLLNILSGKLKPDQGFVRIYESLSVVSQMEDDSEEIVEAQVAGEFHVDTRFKDHMSGGEKTRLKIARCLSSRSSIIFADEPTCNLDIKGIELLERKLASHKGALIVISHDRQLLDRLCSSILEIRDGKIKAYNGNYSSYLMQKEMEKERQQFEYVQYVKAKRKLECAVEEKRHRVKSMRRTPPRMGNSEARLHKMGDQAAKEKLNRSVKAIETRLEKLEVKEKPKDAVKPIVSVESADKLHSKVLISGEGINKSFGIRKIFNDVRFSILNGLRTALIGDNGSGKTTLIRMIMDRDSGIKIAQGVSIGYFAQDMNILDGKLSIMENVMRDSAYSEAHVRNVLARLLFRGNDVYKKVEVLSGGEMVRVSLAKILVSDANVIILDEPTNYLDVFCMEAVENAIGEYDGTVIFVSHDRKFINSAAHRIMIIENSKIITYEGSYEEYLNTRKAPEEAEDIRMQRMILENRLSQVLGKLSVRLKEDEKLALDTEYNRVLKELQSIRK